MSTALTGYSLSRAWFDFAFENRQAGVYHTALYMWIIELNNRLGWKKEFGLPTADTMEGLSIGNRNTYNSVINDIEAWGFIKIIQRAKNQYQSCIIEICRDRNEQAPHQALHQALISHSIKHSTGTDTTIDKGIDTIVKQVNNKINKQINNKNDHSELFFLDGKIESVTEVEERTSINTKKTINIPFVEFWKLYPIKIGKKEAEKKWKNLKDQDREKVIATLPEYIKYQQFPGWNHPQPVTYLNKERWNDDLSAPQKNSLLLPNKAQYTVPKPAIDHSKL